MTKAIDDLKSMLEYYQYNPFLATKASMRFLEGVTDGEIQIADATNPFMYLLTNTAASVCAHMEKSESLNRRQYKAAAQTYDDLYMHMADKDFLGRFAMPAKAKISLIVNKDDLIKRMVLEDSGNYRITIPRHSSFTVQGISFTMQYPVDIRLLKHGGLQATYDTTNTSPLQTLSTNVIELVERVVEGTTKLFFTIDVMQFAIQTVYQPVMASNAFKLIVPYSDQFYFARVWGERSDGTWQEIRTTHAPSVFDPNRLTAALKVSPGALEVMLPQVYITRQMITTNVRVDIYTTVGLMNMALSSYAPELFSRKWTEIDPLPEDTKYSAPMNNLSDVVILSTTNTIGGRNELTFDELKQRGIINSWGDLEQPITEKQAVLSLQDRGYRLVTHIDDVMTRMFLATRGLPEPRNRRLITASASSIETISSTFEALSALDSTYDNGDSITLTPDTIFQNVRGVTKIVPSEAVKKLLQLSPENRAFAVTNGSYFFTPFHYVLDGTDNQFESRAYYLDNPIIDAKYFVSSNTSTLLDITAKAYVIDKVESGYKLFVTASLGESAKLVADSIILQLGLIPVGEKDRGYMTGYPTGTNADGHLIFEFDLGTTFNISQNDELILNSFKMRDNDVRYLRANLTHEFDLIFTTTSVMPSGWELGPVDLVMGREFLPGVVYGVTHERIVVNFGKSLNNLWTRARTIVTPGEYVRHEVDVPRLYPNDIYERDPVTGSAIRLVNGVATFVIAHHKGDPVLDNAGNPIMLYKKGDPVLDASGTPVLGNPRGMLRQFDILLLEGPYWFATDEISKSYRQEIVELMLDWITVDLYDFAKRTLERDEILFYPKATLGEMDVMLAFGRTARINAAQSLQINLTVPESVYRNAKLREDIKTAVIKTINQALDSEVVAISTITTLLRLNLEGDAIDVQLTGLGGGNVSNFTVITPGARASIRKRLVVQGDGSLIVEPDVTVNFSHVSA